MQPTLDQAVEQAYRRYFAVITRKCARMLGDSQEATDVAQETFARLWERRDSLRDPLAVTAWIYRTSGRLAVEHYRRRARTRFEPDGVADIATLDAPHDDPERRTHARRILIRLTAELSDRELEVAILSRLDCATQTEIAEVLGCSERSVRRVLVRIDERTRALEDEVLGS